jgi:ribosomal protein S13
MLAALPKYGRVKATKILQSCQVSPSKTFGDLTERQRAELAERLHRS